MNIIWSVIIRFVFTVSSSRSETCFQTRTEWIVYFHASETSTSYKNYLNYEISAVCINTGWIIYLHTIMVFFHTGTEELIRFIWKKGRELSNFKQELGEWSFWCEKWVNDQSASMQELDKWSTVKQLKSLLS